MLHLNPRILPMINTRGQDFSDTAHPENSVIELIYLSPYAVAPAVLLIMAMIVSNQLSRTLMDFF